MVQKKNFVHDLGHIIYAIARDARLPADRVPVSILNKHGDYLCGSSVPAPGEDLAVAFLLPSEYHGVLIQPAPRLKILALKASFMDPSFEPVSSSDPPRATLAKWWKAVSKRVRDS